MPRLKSLNPSIAVLESFGADTILYAVILTVDPVTLTFDLEHVLHVALGSGIIFTKSDLRQLTRA